MEIKLFPKFVKLTKPKKHLYLDSRLRINDKPIDHTFNLTKNEIVISIENKYYIIYNTKTTKIQCIFRSDINFVQSEFHLNKIGKPTHYIKYSLQTFQKFSKNLKDVKCLILGMCLGNLPNAMIYNCKNISRIDCVEIDKTLVKIYSKYFKFSSKTHIYNYSALDFVKKINRKYHYIYIDIPCKFVTKKLLNLITNLLKKCYMIQINYIDYCEKKKDTSQLFKNFANIHEYKIDDNLIYTIRNN